MRYFIEQAKADDSQILKKMLKRAKMDTSSVHGENFVVVRDKTEIIGCIQLKHYPGVQELSSMLVLRKYRNQGIAKALVQHLLKEATTPIYLICPQHRQSFYEQFNFYPVLRMRKLPLLLAIRCVIGRFMSRSLQVKIIAMRWDKYDKNQKTK